MSTNTTYNLKNLPENMKNYALHLYDNTPFYSMVLENGIEIVNNTLIQFGEKFKTSFENRNIIEGQRSVGSGAYTTGDIFTNYTQIFFEDPSFSASSLASNNGEEHKALAIADKYEDIKLQINQAMLTGVKDAGANDQARKMDGILTVISSNVVDASPDGTNKGELTKAHLNDLFRKILNKTKRTLRNHVIFVNAPLKEKITALYGEQPASFTEGGIAVSRINTDYGVINVVLDVTIPEDQVLVAKMDKLKVCVLPTYGQEIYESEERREGHSQVIDLITEQTLKYGHEGWHGKVINVTV